MDGAGLEDVDVFVSYSHVDRARVEPIVAALEGAGLRVFWDSRLLSGDDWHEKLERTLDGAKAVLVLWSERSVLSRFVKEEATRALGQEKLLAARLDAVQPPLGFGLTHFEDLLDWRLGEAGHAGFDRLLDAVRTKAGQERAVVDPTTLARHRRLIANAQLTYGYRDRITGFLDRIERALEGDAPPGRPILARSFTYQLLNLTLLLAVAYPALSLLIQFAVLGQDATLGGEVLIDASETEWWGRAAACLLPIAFGHIVLQRRQARRAGAFEIVAVAFAVAVAGVVAFAVAGVLAVPGAVAGAGAGALAVALAVAGAGAVGQDWLGRRLRLRGAFLFAFVAVALSALWLVLQGESGALGLALDIDAQERAVIVFLMLLPAVNAGFDFLSIGLTRALLRVGVRLPTGGTVLLGLGDLVIGAALFVLLGCASIALIDVMRIGGAGGETLIDLGAVFSDVRADPHAYWWLYATYFSTLLPTLFHAFAITGAALDGLLAPRSLLNPPRDASDDALDAIAVKAAARLSLSYYLSFPLGIALVGGLVWGFVSLGGGFWLLDVFEAFADAIGALS